MVAQKKHSAFVTNCVYCECYFAIIDDVMSPQIDFPDVRGFMFCQTCHLFVLDISFKIGLFNITNKGMAYIIVFNYIM